jgi:DNA polymerase III epsilon subunit-like protein
MVDLETLGTEPGAAILSVGAVVFDRDGVGETFHASVDLESCQEYGLDIDAATLMWWLQQSAAAREVLHGGDDLDDVLAAFVRWYRARNADELWANSPIFDVSILDRACARAGVTAPWSFWELRDYRTLSAVDIAPDLDQEGTDHDALADARHQARVAAATLDRLDRVDAEVVGDA